MRRAGDTERRPDSSDATVAGRHQGGYRIHRGSRRNAVAQGIISQGGEMYSQGLYFCHWYQSAGPQLQTS